MTVLNQPKLYILRHCHNHIRGMRNYTWENWKGKQGEGKLRKEVPREKWKHFPDCIRYGCVARIRYLPRGQFAGAGRPQRYSGRSQVGWRNSSGNYASVKAEVHRRLQKQGLLGRASRQPDPRGRRRRRTG